MKIKILPYEQAKKKNLLPEVKMHQIFHIIMESLKDGHSGDKLLRPTSMLKELRCVE